MKIQGVPESCHGLPAPWRLSPTPSLSLRRRAPRGEHWWIGGGHGVTSVPSRAPPIVHSPSSAGASDSTTSPLKQTSCAQFNTWINCFHWNNSQSCTDLSLSLPTTSDHWCRYKSITFWDTHLNELPPAAVCYLNEGGMQRASEARTTASLWQCMAALHHFQPQHYKLRIV